LEQRLLAVVKQRVPEWKLVLAVQREAMGEAGLGDREAECRRAVLGNVLMRVMSAYQRHFGELVLESNFEFGRLIADMRPDGVLAGGPSAAGDREAARSPMAAHTLLHLLRALADAPAAAAHTRWLARAKPADEHTHLGGVLMVFLWASQAAVRLAARDVALGVLRQAAGLFDHDASEPAAWLAALAALASPQATRGARIPVATAEPLQQAHALVGFVEAAVAHAAKQPYKYADRIHAAAAAAAAAHGGEDAGGRLAFSPLMAAVAEAAVLKAAAGTGSLAAALRGAAQPQAAAEMQTNAVFALVREAACAVAEAKGAWAARALGGFLRVAAADALRARAAKTHDAAERAHYGVVERAFGDALGGTLAYLDLVAGGSPGAGPAPPPACCATRPPPATGLSPDALAAALASGVPARALALWLVGQAHVGARGQAPLAAAIQWITRTQRTASGAGASLWDAAEFRAAAPFLLQIDDAAFLQALLRHLLAARHAGVLEGAGAQRLLAHVLVAARGSPGFVAVARLLLRRVLRPAAAAATAAETAFVFALVAAHADSLAAGARLAALAAYAEEAEAADVAGAGMPAFALAALARRSARAWLPAADAARIWRPLAQRIAALGAARHALGLALVRVVAPAMGAGARGRLARSLGGSLAAPESAQDVCAVATTVFALLAAGGPCDGDLRAMRDALAARVVALWTRALDDRALLAAATLATAQGAAGASQPLLPLAARIDLVRGQLAAPRQAPAADCVAVLDRLRAAAPFEAGAGARVVLGRLLAGDARLRRDACAWAERAALEPRPRVRLLAWLAHVLAARCAQTVGAHIVWAAGAPMAARVRSLCLALGARLGAADIADRAALFVANAF
ncbi:hypothetical protein GGF37_004712, partial [Kickxella alabastrina]